MSAGAAQPALHDSGEGPVLLMLHAFPLDASQWDHQVAALSGEFRCLRPDMWGCGASPAPPETKPTLDGYAESLLSLLDERGVTSFAVIGSSMGGYTAFALWRKASDRITALILAGTRSAGDTEQRRTEREEQAQHILADDDVDDVVDAMLPRLITAASQREAHIVDPLAGRIRQCTPAGVAFCLRAMAARPDSTELLAAMDAPALVIVGGQDALIPPDDTRELAQHLPRAQLLELQQCGHLPNVEDAPAFNAAVAEFLTGLG
ncbi:MAG: alpha/beta fold hydrolase [Candidatus Dormibacteraeota bacterium]|nr:alpha/beta fold hydrolase [Candidatus Dormibacteraeota bacterium]